jgi:hypothetical protein
LRAVLNVADGHERHQPQIGNLAKPDDLVIDVRRPDLAEALALQHEGSDTAFASQANLADQDIGDLGWAVRCFGRIREDLPEHRRQLAWLIALANATGYARRHGVLGHDDHVGELVDVLKLDEPAHLRTLWL